MACLKRRAEGKDTDEIIERPWIVSSYMPSPVRGCLLWSTKFRPLIQGRPLCCQSPLLCKSFRLSGEYKHRRFYLHDAPTSITFSHLYPEKSN